MNASVEKSLTFDFESYGSFIRIQAEEPDLLQWGKDLATRALVGRLRSVTGVEEFSRVFHISMDDTGQTIIKLNGNLEGEHHDRESMRRFIDAMIRAAVAETAPEQMFIHAGAVAWKGKGIILPATSFAGKSTIVAELVRLGAEYYSDDYAIFDRNGMLHPFPRTISMRTDDGRYKAYDLTLEELGGTAADRPIEVGTVLLTKYKKGAPFDLERLPRGKGVLELVPFTFSFIERPEFSLEVLNNLCQNAIILSGQRGSAEIFAKTFLDFVDNLND